MPSAMLVDNEVFFDAIEDRCVDRAPCNLEDVPLFSDVQADYEDEVDGEMSGLSKKQVISNGNTIDRQTVCFDVEASVSFLLRFQIEALLTARQCASMLKQVSVFSCKHTPKKTWHCLLSKFTVFHDLEFMIN